MKGRESELETDNSDVLYSELSQTLGLQGSQPPSTASGPPSQVRTTTRSRSGSTGSNNTSNNSIHNPHSNNNSIGKVNQYSPSMEASSVHSPGSSHSQPFQHSHRNSGGLSIVTHSPRVGSGPAVIAAASVNAGAGAGVGTGPHVGANTAAAGAGTVAGAAVATAGAAGNGNGGGGAGAGAGVGSTYSYGGSGSE
ncbi:hypothetical protein BGW38_002241, partial [Lunasporangiospora selenospora]